MHSVFLNICPPNYFYRTFWKCMGVLPSISINILLQSRLRRVFTTLLSCSNDELTLVQDSLIEKKEANYKHNSSYFDIFWV